MKTNNLKKFTSQHKRWKKSEDNFETLLNSWFNLFNKDDKILAKSITESKKIARYIDADRILEARDGNLLPIKARKKIVQRIAEIALWSITHRLPDGSRIGKIGGDEND